MSTPKLSQTALCALGLLISGCGALVQASTAPEWLNDAFLELQTHELAFTRDLVEIGNDGVSETWVLAWEAQAEIALHKWTHPLGRKAQNALQKYRNLLPTRKPEELLAYIAKHKDFNFAE